MKITHEQLYPIMLAVDAEYDVKKTAEEYVIELNKYSKIFIDRFKVRLPSDAEVIKTLNLQQSAFSYKKNEDGTWDIKNKDGKTIKKKIFIIDPFEQHLVPQDVYEQRLKKYERVRFKQQIEDAKSTNKVKSIS